ncbi:bacteriophage tail sheath protein [Acetobacter nitrogenifigens DSM 23921 = NBRC 105050]|uniref:Tail protein n=1 Tax=Acetobacter nitrogenifigens DSM 23921 = NBRC 105050 TaxID=1120919 RepID=A0A511X5A1_9PROT|nr:phage tail sheath subtilisin-like domain-containing protein [Acetobacter nitrogenifigens]GBQ92093.1 bacteriophage tail sheath protein [Acetobacter nitrogenifigens DSM 23921 = NBRC 105050]GEN58128.1 tail protein [Acetobacter nitrogenifigens DSM 23921 = NBRC 105050]
MSGSVSIAGYNATNRVPGFYFALDNSKANTASVQRRVLIVGQMITGTGVANVATLSAGYSDSVAKYGAASQCAQMVSAYRKIDTQGEIWVLPLADDASAAAATGSWTISGTATAAGTLSLYVGDQLISVGVSSGDTAATVIASAVTAANQVAGLPVSIVESSTAGTLTATALNKGACGNDILLGVSLLGTTGGQSVPSGLTVAAGTMAEGTTNPTTLATALATAGERVYDLIIHPYTDSGSLNALQEWLNDTAGRWSAMLQLYGHAITAYRGTYGAATAFGITRNDQHATITPIGDSPSSPLIWAAQLGAATAQSMRTNPALPVTGIALTVMPPTDAGRYTTSQRNSLLYDGLATFTVNDSGTVEIERMVTTYQTNSAGVADDSYLDMETLLTAEICMQDLRTFLASQYSGYILVADGSKIAAGQKATTAALIGKAAASRYRYQATQLWVQNADTFASALTATNVGGGVVDLLLPYDFANQLRIVAGSLQFTKS